MSRERDEEWAEIDDVLCLAETQAAILVKVMDRQQWVPKSVISENSYVSEKGDEGTLLVAEWFAEKNELT